MTDPRAPRALLVCDYFIRYESGLAEGLRANGWEPILLGRDHDHAFGGEPGAMRRYLHDRLGADQQFISVEGRVRDLNGWTSLPRVRRRLRGLAPEVTHLQSCLGNDPRLLLAARLRRGKYALTVHDVQTHPGDAKEPWRHGLTMHPVFRNAGVLFVHAESLREVLLARWDLKAPIVVVPHGIDLGDPQPLPADDALLFFGRISAYKGLSVLLDSLERLWPRRPELTLTIAGEGPLPDHAALRDPRVTLVHRHVAEAEVPGLFAASTIVVLPYVEASQSGVGSLAKAHGRPIVASAVGGLPELVSDGSGALVPADDAGALADELDELLADRPRLERQRAAGLRTLRESAGWPVVAERTIEAYERYLGVRPGAARGAGVAA
jgi:glycosyltransferase involved in cell wall biosynthesis